MTTWNASKDGEKLGPTDITDVNLRLGSHSGKQCGSLFKPKHSLTIQPSDPTPGHWPQEIKSSTQKPPTKYSAQVYFDNQNLGTASRADVWTTGSSTSWTLLSSSRKRVLGTYGGGGGVSGITLSKKSVLRHPFIKHSEVTELQSRRDSWCLAWGWRVAGRTAPGRLGGGRVARAGLWGGCRICTADRRHRPAHAHAHTRILGQGQFAALTPG